jgi:protein SCO1/2
MKTNLIRRWILPFLLCAAACVAVAISVYAAEKIPPELQNVGITERLGAQLDLNLSFRDENGADVKLRSVVDGRRPVALFLAYYGCPNLCNLFLNGALESLKNLQMTVGKEFQIVTVSIDPSETPRLAMKKKENYLRAYDRKEAAHGWHFWVNDRPADRAALDTNAKKLAEQAGFGYRYDKEQQQYAHAAAMILLTPEGRISRYLYGIEFQPKDLRLGLVEASGRKIGSVMDHILLFCYNYNPKTKKYSLYSMNLMRASGGLTVFILAGTLGSFWRRNRKSRPEDKNKC